MLRLRICTRRACYRDAVSSCAPRWVAWVVAAAGCTAASVASHPEHEPIDASEGKPIDASDRAAPTPTASNDPAPKPTKEAPTPPLTAPADAGRHGPTIAAGVDHTCALRDGGTVWCWGDNRGGRLGVGSTDERVLRPRPVEHLADVVEIGADYDYSCARDRRGGVWCWGENDDGELATGDTERRARPTKIPGITAKRIVVGFDHACAITTNDTTLCWGSARFSDGGRLHRHPPTEMPSLAGATAIALGDDHDCAIVRGRTLCWGINNSGQIGNGRGGCVKEPAPSCGKCLAKEVCEESPEPAKVVELSKATTIAVTNRTSCALDSSGALWCWGGSAHHRRGATTSEDALTPVRVVAIAPLRTVELDGGHGCGIARDDDGAVWCWGQNVFGEVGVGKQAHDVPPARVRVGNTEVLEISLGLSTTCARTADDVWCWGNNVDGQVGDGTTENRRVPVRVAF